MADIKLSVKNISKKFPGTTALDNVSVDFNGGEIHTLLGKNGAGKSTLVKIISGAQIPDTGEIFLEGKKEKFSSPIEALNNGIVCVYQEMSLIPGLTIAENILLCRTDTKNILGLNIIDWKKTNQKAKEILKTIGVDLDVTQKVSRLNIAEQQIVEIAKAMSQNPSVLILDEPTSALAHHEVKELFKLLRALAEKNVAIIYISHRIQEVLEISDKITILRDAKFIGTIDKKDASPQIISEMMFGEVSVKPKEKISKKSDKILLNVKNLNKKDKLHNINFTLHEGEVLGIAGLMGSGRTELLRILFGVDSYDSGEIFIGDKKIVPKSPKMMKSIGVGLTPEDRKYQGLVQIMSIRDNLSLTCFDRISSGGILSRQKQTALVNASVKNLHIKISNIENQVYSLSGGNQQKVVIGKWISTEPKILMFDEPTRGIDIHAKMEIFQIIRELGNNSIGVIFVSTELEEVLDVADRILVLKNGNIVCEISHPSEISVNKLLEICI